MAAWAQDVCRLAGALLEMAIINWAFQRVAAAGFTPITTPDLVRTSVLEKCGFQPRAENTQVCVDPAEVAVILLHCPRLGFVVSIAHAIGRSSHFGITTVW